MTARDGSCDIRCGMLECHFGCKRARKETQRPTRNPQRDFSILLNGGETALAMHRIADAIEKLAEAISSPTNTPEK